MKNELTPEQLDCVRDLFEAAAERPPAEQDAWLRANCGGDEAVRAKAAQLLRVSSRSDGFLETPLFLDRSEPHTSEEIIGRRIGPYLLLREIGQGGMSTVYLATRADAEFDQQVAIKIVWPGLPGSALLRRFRQERQILASLDHPNIARLLDGGTTTEGWPYLVMEYVDGKPITVFCDEHKLNVEERLRLFCDVCAAVEYAHQQAVIHCDLKPNNILVTPDGVVKLLDFGIAKLLKPDPHATAATTGLHALTPDYASPEQVRGEDAAPGTDVYSLGVLLYELLTGVRPYRIKSPLPHEISNAICEVEPEPPSRRIAHLARSRQLCLIAEPGQLRRRLVGDLDNITLKALAKESTRRYSSPASLASDITRFLTGQPVIARGAHPLYRLGKLLHRHQTAVVVLLIGLFVASSVMLWQWQAGRQAQRLRLYSETVRAASAAQQQGRFDQVRESLLRVAKPERNGFEWRYLWQLALRQPLTLAHRVPLNSAEFWPDSKVLATVGDGISVLSLWDLTTGKLITEYTDTAPVIWWQAFGPFRVKQVGGELKIWDFRSGALLGACPDAAAKVIRLYSNEPQLGLYATYDDGTLKLWHWQTCRAQVLLKIPPASYRDFYQTRDNRRLLTWSGANCRALWDLTTGRRIAELCDELAYGQRDFSRDSRLFFLSVGDQRVKLYEAATGKLLQTITDSSGIAHTSISDDHHRLITAHRNGEAKVWETATGRLLGVLRAGATPLLNMTFLDDDRRLATMDTDGMLRLWDLRDNRLSYSAKAHAPGQPTVHAAPDGQSLVTTGGEGMAKVWRLADLPDDGVINHHNDRVFSVTYSPDGRTLAAASGDQTISLWEAATRRLQKVLTGHTGLVLCVDFARDGRRLVSSGSDGTARVWDVQTGRELLQLLHPNPTQVHFAAFSPDGKLVATACDDKNVRLWDAQTGALVATLAGHTQHVWAVGFAPDGRTLASGSNDETVKLWDVVTRRELATLRGHRGWVWSTVFSPDGRFLATAGYDNTVRLWDLQSRQQIRTFTGHTDEIFEVAFSPDGRRLATASNDNTIKLWEAATGQELLTLKDHTNEVWSVAFSPDGSTLASGSWDKTVRLWHAAK